jgi:GNAT superfamily N-acetyltransferase
VTDLDVAIRTATEADADDLDALMRRNQVLDEPAWPAGAQLPYLRHLIARGTVAVATLDGVITGFGATISNGRATHLADLFVDPEHHGRGIGRRLLPVVFHEPGPRTTFASDDPRALPLYVRMGMTPLWPNLYVAGDPRAVPPVAGHTVEEASLEEMAALESRWAGVDRRGELRYWASLPRARPFVVRAGERAVAAGLGRRRIVSGGHWIDHLVAAPDADPAAAILAAYRDGAGPTDRSGTCVLGPSPALPGLFAAGQTVVDRDTFLASDPSLVDPARELLNTGFG